MKGPPTYGSVCSGIEAATQAWHPLGWRPMWFSEIEPFPCAVLAHHHPAVPNLGDMTTIPARILSREIGAPDVLVGGTPCQSFSVAGLRRGLDDPRGQLTRTFVEILDAIDAVRRDDGKPPAIAVWENVPGVLTDDDNAFGNFLAALVGENVALVTTGGRWSDAGAVLGPTRRASWRILDAQYFGLAQRRRRVFLVVGARTGCVDPVEVLLVEPGVRRDSPPRRETWKDAPAVLRSGNTENSGGRGTGPGIERDIYAFNFEQYAGVERQISPCITQTEDYGKTLVYEGTNAPDHTHMAVRHLTPTECERLQGFPDDHTRIPWKGRPADECPEGPRYRAVGNSMAVPVMHWIGRRVDAVRSQARGLLDDVPEPGDVFDLFGG